jgi:ABC-type branched-subunit amino acid transport system ATPase component
VSAAATALLEFDGLTGGYGTTVVVRDVGGSVAPGQVLCVMGRNGVGKSTLMRLLSGHLRCRAGTIRLNGDDITGQSAHARSKRGLTYGPQERVVFENLSVADNLRLRAGGSRADDRLAVYFDAFPVLRERLRQHAGTLSGGERKILSFVRCLAENQPLVLLDEPTEGVQFENIERMHDFVADARANGTAFVIVEQHVAFALSVADHLLVMDQGRSVLQAPAGEVDRDRLLGYLQV